MKISHHDGTSTVWRKYKGVSQLVTGIHGSLKLQLLNLCNRTKGTQSIRRLGWITAIVYDLTRTVRSIKLMRNRIICPFIYIMIGLLNNNNIRNPQPSFEPAKPGT